MGFSNKKSKRLVAAGLAITAVAPQVISAQDSALEKVKEFFVDFWTKVIFFNWYKKDLLKKTSDLIANENFIKDKFVSTEKKLLKKVINQEIGNMNEYLSELTNVAGLDSIKVELSDFDKLVNVVDESEISLKNYKSSGYLLESVRNFISEVLNKREKCAKEIEKNEESYKAINIYLNLSDFIQRIGEVKKILSRCASLKNVRELCTTFYDEFEEKILKPKDYKFI